MAVTSNDSLRKPQDFFSFAGHLIAVLIVAGFLTCMLWLADVPIGTAASVAIVAGVMITIVVGEIVLSLFGYKSIIARAPMATLTGAIVTSILLLVTSFVTGLSTGTLLIGFGFVALPGWWALSYRRPIAASTEWLDLAAMASAAIIVAIWCRNFAQTVPVLNVTDHLRAWSDYYVHGAQLAEFGDPLAVSRGAILLADYPRIFYHYGIYMLPSALLGVVFASGLTIATAVLVPLGLFLGLTASFVLASRLSGRLAGIVAILLLTALPNAAQYGAKNGFYDFHWMLFTTPGAGYGIAACCVALIILIEWHQTKSTATLVGAIIMTIAIFQMRVHFLIWFAPAIVASFLLQRDFIRRRPGRWLGLIATTSIIVMIGVASIGPLRQFWLSHSAVEPYLNFAYRHNDPNNFVGVFDWLIARIGNIPAVFVATLLLLFAAYGALVLVYPLTLWLAMRRPGMRWTAFDSFPLALIAVSVGMALYAPKDPWGDPTEYQQRSFVLVYAVLIIWSAAYGVSALAKPTLRNAGLWTIAASGGLASIIAVASAFDPAKPLFDWGKGYYNIPIGNGIISQSKWIRGNSSIGATIAVGPVDPKANIVDTATALTSLTNMPTFLARAGSQLKQDEQRSAVAGERLRRLQQVEKSEDAGAAFRLLKEARITLYVWTASTAPPFDPEFRFAAFHSQSGAIYRVSDTIP